MSGEYEVRVPFAGYVSMIVKADSEEEAIDKALQADVRIDLTKEVPAI